MGITRIAVLSVMAVLATATVAVADTPDITFNSAGDTYDPATIRIDEDRTAHVQESAVKWLGGVMLTAVGTTTFDLSTGGNVVPNARGTIPSIYMDPGYPCDHLADPTCTDVVEPFVSCGSTWFSAVGRAPRRRPTHNGKWATAKWSVTGCTGPGVHEGEVGATFPVATGSTTYIVKNLTRTKKAAVYRTYVEGSDGYFNVCLSTDHIGSIVQHNGVRSCTVVVSARVDRVSFILTQRSKITSVAPAFMCSGLNRDGVCT